MVLKWVWKVHYIILQVLKLKIHKNFSSDLTLHTLLSFCSSQCNVPPGSADFASGSRWSSGSPHFSAPMCWRSFGETPETHMHKIKPRHIDRGKCDLFGFQKKLEEIRISQMQLGKEWKLYRQSRLAMIQNGRVWCYNYRTIIADAFCVQLRNKLQSYNTYTQENTRKYTNTYTQYNSWLLCI